MDHSFDFRGLFVLDLANNHQGCLNHGLRIVRESGAVVASRGVRAALKFQLRELDTYVHPAHRAGSPNRHVARFLGTALGRSDFATLARAVRDAGLATMATPFDEGSLDVIEELDVQLIKIASASATDWPLLERVATQNRPVIVSTGGLSFEAIDDLVSFFDHRRVHFALMHCVSIYPTPFEHLQLNQIEVLRRRYPDRVIGFSTHETPEALEPVMIAVAKGAEILERHVGIATDTIKLNAYSSTPAQLEAWIEAAQRARTLCGATRRAPASAEEVASLVDLQRGVYARRPLCAGEQLERSDVYFAMPIVNGGLRSGQWREGTVVRADIAEHAALSADTVALPPPHPKATLFQALHTAKAMLNEARIALPTDFELEFSHHYGVERFPEVGAILIDCINREYCKKIIVQLPGQRHPMHYHRRKDETFHVLAGIMEAEVEGRRRTLVAGDLLVVPQGVWHSFWNTTGLIFEEISSTHHNDDAFYEDKRINAMARDERKSRVSQWGRFQL